MIKDLHFAFPGIINIENLTAAIAIALMCGVTEKEIRKAALSLSGCKDEGLISESICQDLRILMIMRIIPKR